MDHHQRVHYLKEKGVIAIVRADQGGTPLVRTVEALIAGGVHCVEVTMTTPGALDCLKEVHTQLAGADFLMGLGSVLDGETARIAILSGAEYVVCPITSAAVITMGRRYGVPVLPGAFTPTEIVQAWELGGDLIKVFPATLGGLEYIKAVRAPLPQIPLVPTGGITVENIHTFVDAGVAAVGVGSALVSKALVEAGDFNGIQIQAQRFMEAYSEATARRG